MAKQLSGFEKLKAKRAELNGGADGDRFVWRVDPNSEKSQSFAILNPYMLDEDQQDELAQLEADRKAGEILPSELSREMLDIYILDAERDAFEDLAESGDMRPAELFSLIMEEFKDNHSPTRPTSSRRSRR